MSEDAGLRISKPGYDVKTCTIEQLSFISLYNVFKIKDAIPGTWVIAGGARFNDVPKTISLTDYAIAPYYLLYVEVNNKNYYVNNGGFIENVDGANDLFLYTFVDSAAPPVLNVIVDPNANPVFAAGRNLDYYLYLALEDL